MFEFVLGLIGNIVASYIYDTLRIQSSQSPPLVLIVQSEVFLSEQQEIITTIDQRDLNRELAKRIIKLIFFFSVTLLLLTIAIYFPILTVNLSNDELNLGQVKIVGWFTDAFLSLSSLGRWAIIIAAFLYLPLLLLGDRLLVTVMHWYDKFWPVTFNAWMALRFVTFLFLILLVSGIVLYLVTDLSILWSLAIPFIFLLVLVLFVHSESS